jgi:hypothetical protein
LRRSWRDGICWNAELFFLRTYRLRFSWNDGWMDA